MKLGDVCDIVRGSSPRPQGDLRYYGGPIPRLMIADVTRDGMYVTPRIDSLTEEGALKSRAMKKGDIIVAVSGDPGRACILNVDACIHDGFVGLRNLDETKLYKPYLLNFLAFFKNTTKKGAVGAIFQNLTTDQIKKIEIPEIDIKDQVYISNILSKAEALVAQRKESLRLLDEFLTSTFLEMFGHPGRNEKKWERAIFSDLAKIDKHAIPPHQFTHADFYIGLEDIEKESGVIKKTTISNATDLKSSKFEFTSEHILYGKLRPNLNKVAFPKFSGICSTDIFPILPIKGISNKDFIGYLMRSDFFVKEITQRAVGANLPRANTASVETLKVYRPPLKLQNQFSLIVQKAEPLKKYYEESLNELEQLHGSLSQKAFNGKLQSNIKVIPLQASKMEEDYFKKRKALACYIINQSLDDYKFGDTKFEKLLFLSDYDAIKRNFGQQYYQKVAGPYDNAFTNTFYIQVQKSKLFKRKRGEGQTVFLAGANHEKSLAAKDYFSEQELEKVDRLVNIFKRSDYEKPEIIATLYAVWNNRIIRQQQVTDELLKEDFLQWDVKKAKYKNRLEAALAWMRKENIVPDGWGKLIEKPKSKKLGSKID